MCFIKKPQPPKPLDNLAEQEDYEEFNMGMVCDDEPREEEDIENLDMPNLDYSLFLKTRWDWKPANTLVNLVTHIISTMLLEKFVV